MTYESNTTINPVAEVAITRGRFVKLSATGGLEHAVAATDRILGVSAEDTPIGERAPVMTLVGKFEVEAGGPIAAGADITAGALGVAAVAAGGNTLAGVAETAAAAAGEFITVIAVATPTA